MNSLHGLPLPAPRLAPRLDPAFRPAVLAVRAFDQLVRSDARRGAGGHRRRAGGRLGVPSTRRGCCPRSHAHVGGERGRIVERLREVPAVVARRLADPRRRPGGAGRSDCRAHYRDTATGTLRRRRWSASGCSTTRWKWSHTRDLPAGAIRDAGRSGGTSTAAASASISAAATARWRRWSTAAWSSAKRRCGTRTTSRIRQYHFDGIMDSLRKAAAHLPRVDAIGGSAAGVYVNNRVKAGSLFRGVPQDLFDARVQRSVPRRAPGLARRAVRGRQRRRGDGAGRVDVARRERHARHRARHEHRRRLRDAGRQHHVVAERAGVRARGLQPCTRQSTSGRATTASASQYFSQQAVGRLMPAGRDRRRPTAWRCRSG